MTCGPSWTNIYMGDEAKLMLGIVIGVLWACFIGATGIAVHSWIDHRGKC
jgi:hypothetical protein